jgi:caffeoyl-CoA O-methyltransferase
MEISEEMNRYAEEHTTEESLLLAQLNRETHVKIMHPRMLSGHLQGKLLEFISRWVQPRYILEIGTFTGYSALCMAQGLQPDGELHTIEINDELKEFALSFINQSTLAPKIRLHTGNALDIIPVLNITFDMVFIDGEKTEYMDYYKTVIEKVRPGGVIIADNVLWSGKVIEKPEKNDYDTRTLQQFNDYVHRDKRVENLLLPIRDGLMILQKI